MAKKMITVKYFITTYLSDGIIVNKIQVSKRVFDKQLKYIIKQYEQQEKDTEFEVDKNIWTHDFGNYTGHTTQFSYSICSLDFTVLACKEGYQFTD